VRLFGENLDGRSSEYVTAETITAPALKTTRGSTQSSEPFSVIGQQASRPLELDWPNGSGPTRVDALLTRLDAKANATY